MSSSINSKLKQELFSMPVYWFSIPGQIKNIIDELYSFFVANKEVSGKERRRPDIR
ncbi:MAG: NAD(P)H-dependent oxidoreductase [Ruminococcus sp.]|nr:NAD(P)H-dependent oxidoreductase [Ruminococcus sp.]